jgi:hypothetical protein
MAMLFSAGIQQNQINVNTHKQNPLRTLTAISTRHFYSKHAREKRIKLMKTFGRTENNLDSLNILIMQMN